MGHFTSSNYASAVLNDQHTMELSTSLLTLLGRESADSGFLPIGSATPDCCQLVTPRLLNMPPLVPTTGLCGLFVSVIWYNRS
jgi:hypothetical protein